MRVVIDARMLEMSGIGTYIQHLFGKGIYDIALGNVDDIKKYEPNIMTIEYKDKIYGIKEQLHFPYKKLRKFKPDILHVPHYNIPIFYHGKMVVTIHDLIHIILPEFLPNRFAYFYARFMIGLACKKSIHIFTVSENTKNDLIKIFHVKPEKITVTYNGVDGGFKVKGKSQIEYLYDKFSIPSDKKILMYVGNLKPHKNLERLLEAYSKINNIEDTKLVLVGKAFKSENLNVIETKLKIKDKVVHTGVVDKNELVDLYNLADLFVFPSLYEGFGIPPLEAMACGTPVICSNNSSLPEVVGDAAVMFNPYSVKDIKLSIEKVLNNAKLSRSLILNGLKRAKLFTWDSIGKQIKDNLNE